MSPEEVPAAPVEKAEAAVSLLGADEYEFPATVARHALAAVWDDIQAQALRGFSVRLDQSFDHAYDFDLHAWEDAHAEGYRHRDDQVNAVLASAMQDAARLTATAERCPRCCPEPCCDHRNTEYGNCTDCHNTGHNHARCPDHETEENRHG